MNANILADALPLGIGKLGNSAIATPSSLGRLYLGLTILLTKIVIGLISKSSVISSPIFIALGAILSGSIISSTRGKWAGIAERIGFSFFFLAFSL